MLGQTDTSRRSFLKAGAAFSGALVLGVDFFKPTRAMASDEEKFAPDAFIRIAEDDKVTFVMSQVEMGQGIYTSISMLLAEELDVPLSAVKLEAAPPNDKLYGNPLLKIQMTGGSTSMRAYWLPMRRAGAAARSMLMAAAASQWGVDAKECATDSGAVLHRPSGRTARYGSLVRLASTQPMPKDVPLKDPKDFKLIGTPARRLDTPDKVNGSAKYGIDARPPGVRIATLRTSPVFGGTIKGVDDRAARAIPGVSQIVVLDDLVAVVGDTYWSAKKGLEALVVEWDDGVHARLDSPKIWDAMRKAAATDGLVAAQTGTGAEGLEGDGIVESAYELPFLAHAALEPMNCTVDLRPDACEIWVGTQVITLAQKIAAKVSGLKAEQVIVHNHLIGGGFGRRLEVDGIGTAVRIAQQVKGPVKIIWSREEDIQKAMYRSVLHNRMTAHLEGGKVVAWRHRVVAPSILARFAPPAFKNGIDDDAMEGATEPPYEFPNMRAEYVRHEPEGIPTAFWRGVGPNGTVFAVESFIDRLAKAAGTEPASFRRGMLQKNPRALRALDVVLEKSAWSQPLTAAGPGERVGRGLSVLSAFGSFIAAVAEVAVSQGGNVRVTRLVCSVDCGFITNPDTVIAQMQGGMIFGVTAVLHGAITIEDGRVQQSNFNDYRMLRIDETPNIEVHLIRNSEDPGGIGEPGTAAVQPALANAIYAATGVQVTQLPVDRRLIAIEKS
ncbi:xanthine dehydrogenase family protein molybdopterin-binding subunit [Tardiphaga robiniae]|uniref:xanthine dehydrogenase family protein molybdopterin-binding subunit n=1 Tax=Tardiphaga robiniae TaxID=943830 RepID=UPI0035B50CA6